MIYHYHWKFVQWPSWPKAVSACNDEMLILDCLKVVLNIRVALGKIQFDTSSELLHRSCLQICLNDALMFAEVDENHALEGEYWRRQLRKLSIQDNKRQMVAYVYLHLERVKIVSC